MAYSIDDLTRKITELEDALENAFLEKRKEFAYRVEQKRIIFEHELAQRHRRLKVGLWSYIRKARPLIILTAPFIYGLIVPLVFLDLAVFLYQTVCFPVYGLKKVQRRDYIILDRHHLAYLNGLEKLNCSYCAYANGLIAYVGEVASRTEEFWCPIKHASRRAGAHRRYAGFIDYGDAEAYRNRKKAETGTDGL